MPVLLKREIAMQSILAAVALILAIAHPTEARATAGHGVSTDRHVAGLGMPRLPQMPHLPHVPKPKWP
jgi:hypothetical protein